MRLGVRKFFILIWMQTHKGEFVVDGVGNKVSNGRYARRVASHETPCEVDTSKAKSGRTKFRRRRRIHYNRHSLQYVNQSPIGDVRTIEPRSIMKRAPSTQKPPSIRWTDVVPEDPRIKSKSASPGASFSEGRPVEIGDVRSAYPDASGGFQINCSDRESSFEIFDWVFIGSDYL